MPQIIPRTFKGTRDLLPDDMKIREKLITIIKDSFKLFGFSPLETPAIEFLEILAGKYGDDAEKLLYPLKYKDGKTLALRYDLTVPLARVMAMNPHLPKPFKRYQIQPVWRADNPQLKKGRFREFYQCDVDTVGIMELTADAEIIAVMVDVFKKLDIGRTVIKLNSRKILRGIVLGAGLSENDEKNVCRSIDKLDKDGLPRVRGELIDKKFSTKSVDFICGLLEDFKLGNSGLDFLMANVPESESLSEGISDIKYIMEILSEMGIDESEVEFDYSLARGLDYYTGPIFEAVFPDFHGIGSVAGGGRYDDLIGVFSKVSLPAVGTSFGFERIFTLMKDKFIREEEKSFPFEVLVSYMDETLRADYFGIVKELRDNNISSEVYFKPDKMKKQFGYADKKNIPLVITLGSDEKAEGKLSIKSLKFGEQKIIKRENLLSEVNEYLNK